MAAVQAGFKSWEFVQVGIFYIIINVLMIIIYNDMTQP